MNRFKVVLAGVCISALVACEKEEIVKKDDITYSKPVCAYDLIGLCEEGWIDSSRVDGPDYSQRTGNYSKLYFGPYTDYPYQKVVNGEIKDKVYKAYKYELVNNLWNVGVQPNYPAENAFQHIFMTGAQRIETPFPMGWYFSWHEHHGVVSFPAIIYGHRPWAKHSTDNTVLVEKIENIKRLKIHADIQINAAETDSSAKTNINLAYNLGVEVWLYDKDVHHFNMKPVESVSKIHEFHIWFRRNEMHPARTMVEDDIAIDGLGGDGEKEYYSLYHGNGPTGLGNYTVFYLKREKGAHRKDYYHDNPLDLKETINVLPFLKYALNKGYLDYEGGIRTDYVGSLEFGTELMRGEGFVVFNNYEVIVR
jgi:hypothetical protein